MVVLWGYCPMGVVWDLPTYLLCKSGHSTTIMRSTANAIRLYDDTTTDQYSITSLTTSIQINWPHEPELNVGVFVFESREFRVLETLSHFSPQVYIIYIINYIYYIFIIYSSLIYIYIYLCIYIFTSIIYIS